MFQQFTRTRSEDAHERGNSNPSSHKDNWQRDNAAMKIDAERTLSSRNPNRRRGALSGLSLLLCGCAVEAVEEAGHRMHRIVNQSDSKFKLSVMGWRCKGVPTDLDLPWSDFEM